MGNVQNVAVVGNRPKGERESPEFTVVRYWRKIINSNVSGRGIVYSTLSGKAKMLFSWSHVKGVD